MSSDLTSPFAAESAAVAGCVSTESSDSINEKLSSNVSSLVEAASDVAAALAVAKHQQQPDQQLDTEAKTGGKPNKTAVKQPKKKIRNNTNFFSHHYFPAGHYAAFRAPPPMPHHLFNPFGSAQSYLFPPTAAAFNPNYTSFPPRNSYYYFNRPNAQKRGPSLHKLWPHSLKNNQAAKPSGQSKNAQPNGTESTLPATVTKTPRTEASSPAAKPQDPAAAAPDSEQAAKSDSKPEMAPNKTPMCLINELVRYNKIKHEYVLLDEIGPAHKKTFFINLKLGIGSEGEESYSANGSSIKKTQHTAAELALKQTKFKMPPARDGSDGSGKTDPAIVAATSAEEPSAEPSPVVPSATPLTDEPSERSNANKRNKNKNQNIPPTVRLNTLAMKLGLVTNYTQTMTQTAATQLDQHASLFSNQAFDFTATNYTNFMSNEYKPFKYQPTHIYPGIDAGAYLGPYGPMRGFDANPLIAPVSKPHPLMSNPANDKFRRRKANFNMIQRPKQTIHVKLTFGNKEFHGQGISLQIARHDAAAKALEFFTDPENFLQAKSLASSPQAKSAKAYRPPQFYQQQENLQKKEDQPGSSVQPSESGAADGTKNETGPAKAAEEPNGEESKTDAENPDSAKSEVQLVHEYAFRLKKTVDFELIQESGPSHIKKFVTKCRIGTKSALSTPTPPPPTTTTTTTTDSVVPAKTSDFVLESVGEGNSKRLSKKSAAVQMLAILREKFEPLLSISTRTSAERRQQQQHPQQQQQFVHNLLAKSQSTESNGESPSGFKHRKSKAAKNIVKLKKTSPEYGKGSINPISRLIQIQQAKKETEPLYQLLSCETSKINNFANPNKKFLYRRRQEFVMQCLIEAPATIATTTTTIGTIAEPLKSEGRGQTKKLAKQRAAEAMLIMLGYQPKPASALKPSIKPAVSSGSPTSEAATSPTGVETTTPTTQPPAPAAANSEKKVKFLEEDLIVEQPQPPHSPVSAASTLTQQPLQQSMQINDKKVAPKFKSPSSSPHVLNNNHQHYKQQKMKNIQLSISNSLSSPSSNGLVDKASLELVYKIAAELLDSIKKPDESVDMREFYSATAEQVQKDNGRSVDTDAVLESNRESEERKIQLKILNGGVDVVNYKRMLEYLAETMGFKVNYQSLLGRDGTVISYVSISVLPDTDKPLNGHGSTHIESSNAAALCALQYLSSKCASTPKVASPPAVSVPLKLEPQSEPLVSSLSKQP